MLSIPSMFSCLMEAMTGIVLQSVHTFGSAQVTVLSRKNIVTRYLQGSFTADLISVIPFDLMARGIEGNSSHRKSPPPRLDCTIARPVIVEIIVLTTFPCCFLNAAGSLAVRICSLVKMMRLMRLGRIVRRVEASNPINYGNHAVSWSLCPPPPSVAEINKIVLPQVFGPC